MKASVTLYNAKQFQNVYSDQLGLHEHTCIL